MLKLKNIIKNYKIGENVVEAIRGINLEFRRNEFVSILGPSGCGKTTLLNIIGGLDRYSSGDLYINGKSTKDFTFSDWDSYRNHSVGFVFQNYNLISHQSVLGNVELALTLSGISKTERRRRAVETLNKVGLHDQIYKKPNQLSGGQMQRVAIARALVNNPEILLADEPTGALDSETSIQIMELLKEIAKDRLIIMVTHNPSLANTYSTRIVNLLDGLIIDDTNPYESKDESKKLEKVKNTNYKKEKTAMSFFTALSLSLRNLVTKKGRTILISFAGSIGIIGIALVLALSNGFQKYVTKMQVDTISNYPLTISEDAIDFSAFMEIHTRSNNDIEEFPDKEEIYINKIMERMPTQIKNNLSEEYIYNVINKIDENLYYSISYQYSVDMNIFKDVIIENNTYYQKVPTNNIWSEMIETNNINTKYDIIENQYDVLKGKMPNDKNEIVLVLNSYNQIDDITLQSLGLNPINEVDSISFDDIIGQKYKLFLNDILYTKSDDKFISNALTFDNYTILPNNIYNMEDTENIVELEIVGIVRPNPDATSGSIQGTIAYTKDLTEYVLNNSENSQIVQWMKNEGNENKDPFTGETFIPTPNKTAHEQTLDTLGSLGGIKTPIQINIYPVDFDAKETIKDYLDNYNQRIYQETIEQYYLENGITEENASIEQKKEAEALGKTAGVYYTDLMDIMVGTINTVINSISYVLIAFTAISLVVSSIMIGIITYISVLERTKEIGVLRSIGARKKDISRVFNAETLIIGFSAGTLGVLIAFLISIPISSLLNKLVNIRNLATLKISHAIILITISMILTLIAGLLPSRIAAKKDPVVALRSE